MPVLRSKQQGDLYIQVEVETPKSLTRKQRELLKEFEKATTKDTSPTSEGFFAKLGRFLTLGCAIPSHKEKARAGARGAMETDTLRHLPPWGRMGGGTT